MKLCPIKKICLELFGVCSIPGGGTKMPYATQSKDEKEKNKKKTYSSLVIKDVNFKQGDVVVIQLGDVWKTFLAIIVFSSSTLSPKETMYKIDQSRAFGIEVLLKHLPRIPTFLKFTERGTMMLAVSEQVNRQE